MGRAHTHHLFILVQSSRLLAPSQTWVRGIVGTPLVWVGFKSGEWNVGWMQKSRGECRT